VRSMQDRRLLFKGLPGAHSKLKTGCLAIKADIEQKRVAIERGVLIEWWMLCSKNPDGGGTVTWTAGASHAGGSFSLGL
jgi:hypothetical protein